MVKAVLWGLALLPFVCQAEVTADVGLVSDYRSYGISQTEQGPALQVSLDYSHDSGFYAGSWASNVDYGNGDDTNIEWDFYAGLYRDLSDNLGLDLGYAWYSYYGADYSSGYDYGEIYAGLSVFTNTSLYWFHASDFGGAGVAHNILKLSHVMTLGDYSLALTLAHSESADKNIVAWDDNEAAYQYAEIAVARDVKGFTLSAALMATTIDTDFNDNADAAIVIALNRGFELLP